jgi:hypothetical protein
MNYSTVCFLLQTKLCIGIVLVATILQQPCHGEPQKLTSDYNNTSKPDEKPIVNKADVMQQWMEIWERNLAVWTNQPRGYVTCNPLRIERLLAGQTNTVLAVQLTNAWERLQLACTNKPIKLNEYIGQTLKEKGGPKGDQAQFAQNFLTMLTCLPLAPLMPPCIGVDPDYRRSDVLKWYLMKEAITAAPYLIESGDTLLDMASLIGDFRANAIKNFNFNIGRLFIQNYPANDRERIRLIYNWNIAMLSYQRSIESLLWQWSTCYEWNIRNIASKLPPEKRKVFLDEIARRAKSDAKEIELLNKPLL